MQKSNQLKLNTNKKLQKAMYYNAFNFLNNTPLFKARLFEYFDYDIERAFRADKNDVSQMCAYYEMAVPREFIENKSKLDLEACYNLAFKDKKVKFLTYEDENYPPLLKQIPDFPLALYYFGNIEAEDFSYPLAIVGSRNATQAAKCALSSIVSGFKNSNILIVSGLAYGIDAQAHQSALDNNVKTFAVVGSGLDKIYPLQNKKLFYDILDNNGAILSEYPLGSPPFPSNFPQRNRIVVGMSKGTLVAEARMKSGAMISANLTLDYDRELMCIPGNILNSNTSGIYHLIKNGASIVTEASDLLNNLGWDIILNESNNNDALSVLEKTILKTIENEEKSFDEIALKAQDEISAIMAALTELELKGLIKQANNKYFKV